MTGSQCTQQPLCPAGEAEGSPTLVPRLAQAVYHSCRMTKTACATPSKERHPENRMHPESLPNSVPDRHCIGNGNGMILAECARHWSPGSSRAGTEIAEHRLSTTWKAANSTRVVGNDFPCTLFQGTWLIVPQST